MVTYTPESEEETQLSFLESSESSHAGSQRMFISSPPDSTQAISKLDEVDNAVASIDSRMIYMESKLTYVDSRTLSIDSKMQSMEFKLRSMISHIERLLDTQTFLKLDYGHHKGIIYEKVDTFSSTGKSSQTALEPVLFVNWMGSNISLPMTLIGLNCNLMNWLSTSSRVVYGVEDQALEEVEEDQVQEEEEVQVQEVIIRVTLATDLDIVTGFEAWMVKIC
ncbi:hypothetical protein F511_16948 [Dorcoceras hygrometricum]|uniref:Uncharacterized protein n=1 Tax=Dorcoceras hygrometricum TaxID=472368 RepID=A0A2Z7D064_9LAMI|nr:hypothetical protein F511_16948 [Dorcoceras hygrometricum]